MSKTTALLTTPVTSPPVTSDPIPTINTLHAAATQLAEEARAKANAATQMALVIGLKLIALKSATPHGQWEKLFSSSMRRVGKSNESHVTHLEFPIETARRYIAVATEITLRIKKPEQAQAIQHIAASDQLAPAEAALLEEITPPETLRQLYLQMGIVKPTKKELHALTAPQRPEKEEPTEPPAPLSPAQRLALKRDEARSYWFGSTAPDTISLGSFLMACQQELNQPEQGRLHYLEKADLLTMADFLSQLLTRVKKITKEIS
jgi:hypothetical protein